MDLLANAILTLAPGAIWSINNDDYDTIDWQSPDIPKPTIEEITDEINRLKAIAIINDLKLVKLSSLDDYYTAAQYIKVTNEDNSIIFIIPLKGDTFNIQITNQVLAAQVVGNASLIFPDINGVMQTIIDLAFSEWQKFYVKAKTISFSNLILKTDKIIEINNCQTAEELNKVNLDIFPAIDKVIIDI